MNLNSLNSQFLIAQYVAGQLRASMEEDFTPWTPEMQTPTMTPKVSTPTVNHFDTQVNWTKRLISAAQGSSYAAI